VGSDDLFKKRKGVLKKRKEQIREQRPHNFLIVCEGTKTEPNYFASIRNIINSKHRGAIDLKFPVKIDIVGTGYNTQSLIEETENIIRTANKEYGVVWCVFDKDDFSDSQFNNSIKSAETRGYNVGWSNEAFELWILLHFEEYSGAGKRSEYCNRLNRIFKARDISSKGYEKNRKDIYFVLCEYGQPDNAVKRASRLLTLHEGKTPAKMKPATKVHLLYKNLIEYL